MIFKTFLSVLKFAMIGAGYLRLPDHEQEIISASCGDDDDNNSGSTNPYAVEENRDVAKFSTATEAGHFLNSVVVCPTGPGNLVKKKQSMLCFPFQPMCVTLVVGPSNCGKSEIVKGIIENQDYFYNEPLKRVVFIMCNPRASVKLPNGDHSPRPLPEIVVTGIDTFDPAMLRKADLVIFEDLSVVTEIVRSVVNVDAHHLCLAGVFVIVQGFVGTKRYELIHYCHKALFFVKQRTGMSNLDHVIRGSTAFDKETKEYIKKIASYCRKVESPLLIEINPIEGAHMPKQMAISHLKDLLSTRDKTSGFRPSIHNFAVVHPHLHTVDNYVESVDPETAVKEVAAANMPKGEHLPPFSYVLVPADYAITADSDSESDADGARDVNSDGSGSFNDSDVSDYGRGRKRRKRHSSAANKKKRKLAGRLNQRKGSKMSSRTDNSCLNPKLWNEAMENMEEAIERSFDRKQWLNAKNVCREILQSPKFCITSDMKTVHIKESSKNVVPILDFIYSCIRRNYPKENESLYQTEVKQFGPFIKAMIQSGSPIFIFKNKKLLSAVQNGGKKIKHKNETST